MMAVGAVVGVAGAVVGVVGAVVGVVAAAVDVDDVDDDTVGAVAVDDNEVVVVVWFRFCIFVTKSIPYSIDMTRVNDATTHATHIVHQSMVVPP